MFMKKIFAFFLAVLSGLSLCSCSGNKTGASSGKISLPEGKRPNILALGDSIAAGYGLESQDDNYLSIFSENIGGVLQNDAVSGYDSADLLTLVSSGRLSQDIANADVIIISIGGNDLLHNNELLVSTLKNAYLKGGEFFPEEVKKIYSDFESNLASVLDLLRSKNKNAPIILQTLYNPAEKQGYKIAVVNVGKLVNKYIDLLNETVFNICNGRENVFVFDVAPIMNKDADNFYNLQSKLDIHPTKKGHQTLSEIFTEEFNKLTN